MARLAASLPTRPVRTARAEERRAFASMTDPRVLIEHPSLPQALAKDAPRVLSMMFEPDFREQLVSSLLGQIISAAKELSDVVGPVAIRAPSFSIIVQAPPLTPGQQNLMGEIADSEGTWTTEFSSKDDQQDLGVLVARGLVVEYPPGFYKAAAEGLTRNTRSDG